MMNNGSRGRARRVGGGLAGVAALLLLAGCDEVTVYEAGVYKGKADESATERAAAERADALRERSAGQLDR
jgi:predicted NAD/FAD-binding protein